MEKGGGKRCYVGKINDSDWDDIMCMRGSHPGNKGASQVFWHPRDENQGRNYENIAKLRSWESEKSLHSKVKAMLEIVFERVLSTDSGIRELKEMSVKEKEPLMENVTPSIKDVD
ncbi:hypothetical protein HAX54_048275, partial [Datura stramonium]|nr:hypothetical protein [Datura stramonium]